MEATTVQIQYDSEKLCLLKRYMRDESELSAGLEAHLQFLYELHVPADIRKSIDRKEKGGAI